MMFILRIFLLLFSLSALASENRVSSPCVPAPREIKQGFFKMNNYDKEKAKERERLLKKYPALNDIYSGQYKKIDKVVDMFFQYGEGYAEIGAKLYLNLGIDEQDAAFLGEEGLNRFYLTGDIKDKQDKFNIYPLLRYMIRKNLDISVRSLIKYGASPYIPHMARCYKGKIVNDNFNNIIFHALSTYRYDVNVQRALLEAYVEKGYDVHYLDGGYSSLLEALSYALGYASGYAFDVDPNDKERQLGVYELYDYALSHGFNLFDGKNYANTSISVLIAAMHFDYIEKLIEQGYLDNVEAEKGLDFRNKLLLQLSERLKRPQSIELAKKLTTRLNIASDDPIMPELKAGWERTENYVIEQEELRKKAEEL